MDSRTSRRILAATRVGRSTEVIDLARKALAEDANDVEALYHLAQGLDSAGEPGEALPYAERAITVLPTYEGLLLAARCASKAGHHHPPPDALSRLFKVVRYSGGRPESGL